MQIKEQKLAWEGKYSKLNDFLFSNPIFEFFFFPLQDLQTLVVDIYSDNLAEREICFGTKNNHFGTFFFVASFESPPAETF